MNIFGWMSDQLLCMQWLSDPVAAGVGAAGLDRVSIIGRSVQFFVGNGIKIVSLLAVLISAISYVQSFFPPERTQRISGGPSVILPASTFNGSIMLAQRRRQSDRRRRRRHADRTHGDGRAQRMFGRCASEGRRWRRERSWAVRAFWQRGRRSPGVAGLGSDSCQRFRCCGRCFEQGGFHSAAYLILPSAICGFVQLTKF